VIKTVFLYNLKIVTLMATQTCNYRILVLAIIFLISIFEQISGQYSDSTRVIDSATSDSLVILTHQDGSAYIAGLLDQENLWRSADDPIRKALSRMLDQYNEPYDSARQRLIRFPFDSISFQNETFTTYDSLPVTWLNDSSLILVERKPGLDPFKEIQVITTRRVDSTVLDTAGLTEFEFMMDTLFNIDGHIPEKIDTVFEFTDTSLVSVIDTAYLDSLDIPLYLYAERRFFPPLPLETGQQAQLTADSSLVVLATSEEFLVGDNRSPFYIVPGEYITDSLKAAVDAISSYTFTRDSILIFFNDLTGRRQPFWLTSDYDDLSRYWIKNRKNDSITIWVGNPVKNEISLLLEDDVSINRMEKILADDIPITTFEPETSLAKIEPLKPIPIFWTYGFASSFALNQTYLSNWAKGGESSLSTMLDIRGSAEYQNKSSKTKWKSDGRLKYGSILTAENGLRTNTDMLELNSQYNREISKQVDFSAIFYMKNQLAKGYNFPNDSVVVSKFLNPTTFTVGLGAEYKPFKKTVINFSPLSYKNTFVLDTAEIDQTNHGIDPDRKVRQEMGGQLLVKNELEILDGLNIANSLRLFSNYFDEPQKVDMDWEMTLEKRISWYASIALNLHLIYDDDIRFPVLDDNGEQIKLPDGSIQKEPKLQFKEFIGLTFALKF